MKRVNRNSTIPLLNMRLTSPPSQKKIKNKKGEKKSGWGGTKTQQCRMFHIRHARGEAALVMVNSLKGAVVTVQMNLLVKVKIGWPTLCKEN